MPAMYGKAPGILEETISKIAFNTEYSTKFTGTTAQLQHVRIPTALHRTAWDEAQMPGSSRAVQPPLRERRLIRGHHINLQGLQPNPTPSRAKSAVFWRPPGGTFSDQSRTAPSSRSDSRPTPTPRRQDPRRPSTAELLRRPPSLVARRPQTLQSRHPKDFRYFDRQCFFYTSKEPRRAFFVISPDWVSERKATFIRKNNVFG